MISFTGKVISKKHPEAEELFMKPGKKKRKNATEAVANVKKGNSKTDSTKKYKKREKSAEKGQGDDAKPGKKKVDDRKVADQNDNDNGGDEGAAFEAWCKKQNQHFDDCESFELSIEVESTE